MLFCLFVENGYENYHKISRNANRPEWFYAELRQLFKEFEEPELILYFYACHEKSLKPLSRPSEIPSRKPVRPSL